jgi:DNA-binding NarL/FixJ family response regulator
MSQAKDGSRLRNILCALFDFNDGRRRTHFDRFQSHGLPGTCIHRKCFSMRMSALKKEKRAADRPLSIQWEQANVTTIAHVATVVNPAFATVNETVHRRLPGVPVGGATAGNKALPEAARNTTLPKQRHASDESRQLPLANIKTVAVVDDHPLFRCGVIEILRSSQKFRVVAAGGSKDEAIAAAEQHLPDLMILDLNMPGGGVEAARHIIKAYPDVKVLFLTVSDLEQDVFSCLQAGARGYIVKGTSGSALVRMAEAVCQGGLVISPSVAFRLLTRMQNRTVVGATSADHHDFTPWKGQILYYASLET